MKSNLLTPDDLNQREQNDPREMLSRMQSTYLVLEQSIAAQAEVARRLENQPDQYAVAVKVVEGLQDSYAETRMNAAVLDLEILLNGKLQVAGFLERMAQQIRTPQPQQVPPGTSTPPESGEPPVPGASNGTSVATTDDAAKVATPAEDEELIN